MANDCLRGGLVSDETECCLVLGGTVFELRGLEFELGSGTLVLFLGGLISLGEFLLLGGLISLGDFPLLGGLRSSASFKVLCRGGLKSGESALSFLFFLIF